MDIITRLGLIGIGVAMLWVFSCIWRFGSLLVQEPSRIVLVLEIILVSGVVILSIINLIRRMKND